MFDRLSPLGVRITFGSGVVDPGPGLFEGVIGFAVGLEWPIINEPYGDLVAWHHSMVSAQADLEARASMFLPSGRRVLEAEDWLAPLTPAVTEWCLDCDLPLTLRLVEVFGQTIDDEGEPLWPIVYESMKTVQWEGAPRYIVRRLSRVVEHPFPA